MAPLLDQRGVVDGLHRLRPTHELVSLLRQHALKPCMWPGRSRYEVVKLLLVAGRNARCHRFHALALAGQKRAVQIDRRPASLFGAGKGGYEKSQPSLWPEFTCRGYPARLSKQEIGDINLA